MFSVLTFKIVSGIDLKMAIYWPKHVVIVYPISVIRYNLILHMSM